MFNANQKVVCIRDENCKPMLRNGDVYTVAHEFAPNELTDKNGGNGGGVMILNHINPRTGVLIRPPCFWAANRFRAATDAEIASGPTACETIAPTRNVGTPVPVSSAPESIQVNVNEEDETLTQRVAALERSFQSHVDDCDIHN